MRLLTLNNENHFAFYQFAKPRDNRPLCTLNSEFQMNNTNDQRPEYTLKELLKVCLFSTKYLTPLSDVYSFLRLFFIHNKNDLHSKLSFIVFHTLLLVGVDFYEEFVIS